MVLTTADITEITERHRRVDVDPRFTDKLAHRDRGRLLEHIAGLDVEAPEHQRRPEHTAIDADPYLQTR